MKVYIKTEETIIKFDDINNPKQRFLQHKNPILIKILEINKIVVFNNVSFWKNEFKCLLATKIIKKIIPLCIFLPRTNAYRKNFEFVSF